jgi:hypothetical protein
MILQYVFSFGAVVRQKLRDIVMSSLPRNLKCSPALVVLCVDISRLLNKRECDIEAPTRWA